MCHAIALTGQYVEEEACQNQWKPTGLMVPGQWISARFGLDFVGAIQGTECVWEIGFSTMESCHKTWTEAQIRHGIPLTSENHEPLRTLLGFPKHAWMGGCEIWDGSQKPKYGNETPLVQVSFPFRCFNIDLSITLSVSCSKSISVCSRRDSWFSALSGHRQYMPPIMQPWEISTGNVQTQFRLCIYEHVFTQIWI